MKFYTDASYNIEKNITTISYYNDYYMDAKEIELKPNMDVTYAEGMAILHVLQNFDNITTIFTDALIVTKFVKGLSSPKKAELNKLISEIKKYEFNLIWIPSHENKAHSLAYNHMKKISKDKPIILSIKKHSQFPPKKNKEMDFNEKWFLL
ncbi:hypothetical protein LCGC14_0176370 [marine sediment metagenome]|uniref:RNase H type-1 domain-containing protein n=1 Tax=marine sediment metagenome TaxID=412755 RepID=A0A0F9XU02_9ZZZZ